MPEFGVLVISLDFELHWGVRDHAAARGPYRANLLGARTAIPEILRCFEEFGVAATWATVGFLFARDRRELLDACPVRRPAYADARLSPYEEPIGQDEQDDPLHFAPSLVDRIAATPRQEIATHTFSHYYCLEPGQNREDFRADIESAVRLARARGIQLHSVVFPRNQHNPEYNDVLREAGIRCYRGNPPSWVYRAAPHGEHGLARRAARLIDAYLPFTRAELPGWGDLQCSDGLCDVPATLFLRPYAPTLRHLDRLRVGRMRRAIGAAARDRRLVHLWWHPHNFGVNTRQNLDILRAVLAEFQECRDRYGMRSMTMAEVAETAMRL